MRAVLLLVGRVVLFIDDDKPEIGVRKKQRRARADHHRHLIGRDRGPGARAQSRRNLRMPFRRPRAEAFGETIERLPGERDFRHQDQRLPFLPDVLRHRLEIDLRLARAGDAVEQSDGGAALVDRGAQRVGRGQLRQNEVGRAEIRIGRQRHGIGRQHQRFQRAFVDQPVDHAGGNAGLRAASPLARVSPSAKSRSARARAGVIPAGAGPPRRTPTRSRAGPSCSARRSTMRSTIPRGLSV